VSKGIFRCYPLPWVVDEELLHEVYGLTGQSLHPLHRGQTARLTLVHRKIEIHVRIGISLELCQEFRGGGAADFVDPLYLICLVGPGKQGVEGQNLKHYAPQTPHIHFITVVPLC